MEVGGNEAWREFYVSKVREGGGDADWKVPPTAEVLEERYGGAVGEEWKERLSCLVEGREFSGIVKAPTVQKRRVESPAARGGRGGSPAGVGRSKKEANEAYFARMGNANSSRPEGVAPSQGGKYAGFGSAPMGGGGGEGEGEKVLPGVDEFQRDPVAALTKGFGWLSSTVGKGAKTVNEGWVKPTAQKVSLFVSSPSIIEVLHARCYLILLFIHLPFYHFSHPQINTKKLTPLPSPPQLAESDLTLQARQTALSVSQSITTGTKGAADSLTKFIDPDRPLPNHAQSRKVEPEHRDFWDSFGAPEVKMSEGRKGGAIGTAAMRKGGIGGGGGAGKEDDKWDDF